MRRISSMCDDPKSKCLCRLLPPIQPVGFHLRRRQPFMGVPKHIGCSKRSAPSALESVAGYVTCDYGIHITRFATTATLDQMYSDNGPLIYQLMDGSKIHLGPRLQVLPSSISPAPLGPIQLVTANPGMYLCYSISVTNYSSI
jgi:hypothetical protein